jgi:hypothetical protein
VIVLASWTESSWRLKSAMSFISVGLKMIGAALPFCLVHKFQHSQKSFQFLEFWKTQTTHFSIWKCRNLVMLSCIDSWSHCTIHAGTKYCKS